MFDQIVDQRLVDFKTGFFEGREDEAQFRLGSGRYAVIWSCEVATRILRVQVLGAHPLQDMNARCSNLALQAREVVLQASEAKFQRTGFLRKLAVALNARAAASLQIEQSFPNGLNQLAVATSS